MRCIEKVTILAAALREIGEIAIEPGGERDALVDAQKIAVEAPEEVGLAEKTVVPFRKPGT